MSFPRTFVCLLAALLAATGCVPTANLSVGDPRSPGGPGGPGLDAWVQGELVPYLAAELGGNPRFRGEPVMLVRLQGEQVSGRIDGLTEALRRYLRERLLSTPGVHLAWRASANPYARDGAAPCPETDPVAYYVGIEPRDMGGGRLAVAVRALDARERAWVSGFGLTWRGPARPAQRRALGEGRVDARLRGLRVLPFEAGEVDLLAEDLAERLACHLRASDQPVRAVYVDAAAGPPFLRSLMTLVANNLSRDPGLRVSGTAAGADARVEGELRAVAGDLHQVWVLPRQGDAPLGVAGAGTRAYVRLDPSAASRPAPPAVSPPARLAPVVEPARSVPRGPLIERVQVLEPVYAEACGRGDPWRWGAQEVGPGGSLARGDCFAVEVSLGRAARLFLLRRGPEQVLEPVRPAPCARLPARRILGPGPVRLPEGGGAFRLEGDEAYYVLAIEDAAVRGHLGRLDPCRGPAADPVRIEAWLRDLDRLVQARPGSSEWRAVHIHPARWSGP
jgi:hypothetical protein